MKNKTTIKILPGRHKVHRAVVLSSDSNLQDSTDAILGSSSTRSKKSNQSVSDHSINSFAKERSPANETDIQTSTGAFLGSSSPRNRRSNQSISDHSINSFAKERSPAKETDIQTSTGAFLGSSSPRNRRSNQSISDYSINSFAKEINPANETDIQTSTGAFLGSSSTRSKKSVQTMSDHSISSYARERNPALETSLQDTTETYAGSNNEQSNKLDSSLSDQSINSYARANHVKGQQSILGSSDDYMANSSDTNRSRRLDASDRSATSSFARCNDISGEKNILGTESSLGGSTTSFYNGKLSVYAQEFSSFASVSRYAQVAEQTKSSCLMISKKKIVMNVEFAHIMPEGTMTARFRISTKGNGKESDKEEEESANSEEMLPSAIDDLSSPILGASSDSTISNPRRPKEEIVQQPIAELASTEAQTDETCITHPLICQISFRADIEAFYLPDIDEGSEMDMYLNEDDMNTSLETPGIADEIEKKEAIILDNSFTYEHLYTDSFNESEEVSECGRYVETSNVGAQTNHSFIAPSKKLNVRIRQTKEIIESFTHEENYTPDLLTAMNIIDLTLDQLDKDLHKISQLLAEPKLRNFTTQTEFVTIVEKDDEEEEEDEAEIQKGIKNKIINEE